MGKGRFRLSGVLAVFVAILPATGPLGAQVAGDIQAHVQDAQGQAMPGVPVKLLQAGKPETRDATSDAQGDVRFADLASGVYIATAAMEGFSAVTCPGVRIVGVSRRLEITLRPAGGEQTSSCRLAEAK